MKNKKKMALALISVLSLSVLTLSVFADTPVISSNSDTSVQETQKDQQHKEKSNNSSTDEKSTDSEMGGKTDGCRGQGMHHGRHDEEKVAEPENAIGSDAAEAKALEDAGVTEDQAGRVMSHVSQLDDGTVVYRVHFIYNDQMYFYQINATSGEIVDKSNEAATEDKMTGHRGHSKEKVDTATDSSTQDATTAA